MKPAKLKKLVITAAGKGTRLLPLTQFQSKETLPILNVPAIFYLVNEAVDAGIEEIYIVVNSLKNQLTKYFNDLDAVIKTLQKHNQTFEAELLIKAKKVKIAFVVQKKYKGIGAALLSAKSYLKNKPFALFLGDEVFLSNEPQISKCVDLFNNLNQSVVGLCPVNIKDVNKYGIAEVDSQNNLVLVEEKPHSVNTNEPLSVCGRYVFTSNIFSYLKPLNDIVCLTKAMNAMSKVEKINTVKLDPTSRCDLGSIAGILKANQMASKRFVDLED